MAVQPHNGLMREKLFVLKKIMTIKMERVLI